RHFVAVGETTPNYFPSYGFTADDAYSFHVGTRFMLEMEMQRVDESFEPPGARSATTRVIHQLAPSATIERLELAALFKCDADYQAFNRRALDGRALYVAGAVCPQGFYPMTDYPPQTMLRLHLGKLIRTEAKNSRG